MLGRAGRGGGLTFLKKWMVDNFQEREPEAGAPDALTADYTEIVDLNAVMQRLMAGVMADDEHKEEAKVAFEAPEMTMGDLLREGRRLANEQQKVNDQQLAEKYMNSDAQAEGASLLGFGG